MDTPPIESHCARCLRRNPEGEDDYPTAWEVVVDADGKAVGIICEDCIRSGVHCPGRCT